jgi:hypothetical protein
MLVSAQARDMDPGLIELFVDGKEDGLLDAGRLDDLGLGSGSVVFMLFRQGWRWEGCGSEIVLSGEGLVATKTAYTGQLATGGSPMTEGRHYWEVELTAGNDAEMKRALTESAALALQTKSDAADSFVAAQRRKLAALQTKPSTKPSDYFLVGAVRPGLDHDEGHSRTNGAYFIRGYDGALWGNDMYGADPQGKFANGGRIGVLLDLDAGWMRLYRNGKLCGPGFTEGVTGPLVRAAQLIYEGDKLTVLPGAVAPPEGAGAADEPLDCSTYSLAQLKDACRAKGLPVGGTKAALRARLEAAAAPPPQ